MENTMITLDPETMEDRAPYHLLTSICAPRPITLISTVNAEGEPNLAPFSFFNAMAGFPPTIMFSVSYRMRSQPREKDTLRNVEKVGEFVAHVVDEAMSRAMLIAGVDWPPSINEFEAAGLAMLPSVVVRPPRAAAAPVAMECKVTQIIPVEGSTNVMVLGRVLRFHVRSDLYRANGLVDTRAMNPIARLGGAVEYSKMGEVFELECPEVDLKSGKVVA